MDNYIRIIDANLNRVSEGIRVLEDIFRFEYENTTITQELRYLRHCVRNSAGIITPDLLKNRQVDMDPGVKISAETKEDKRLNKMDLIHANFKRVQEGIRSIEEVLKTIDKYDIAKQYESLRFKSYTLEKKSFNSLVNSKKKRKQNFPETDIYCLTDEELSCGRSNITVVEEMIKAGIKIIQYREKEKPLNEKYYECMKIRELTQANGVKFIVNDHVDLALMTKADGVHIGQTDYPVEAVRKLTGDDFIIGLSTHAPEEAIKAQEACVDYIGVGPIYSTQTKKDVCAPVGYSYLEFIVKNISIPFVAIGGIKEHNLDEIIKRGASCVGIVSEITGAENIGIKIQNIRNKIKEYKKYV